MRVLGPGAAVCELAYRTGVELTERFDRALGWASALHRSQRRKGGDTPYLAHLLAVSGLVIEHGGDEDQAIAALLHDSIEDQGVRDEEIVERFGARVASIVRASTDADVLPKPPWLARKRAYLAHLPAAGSEVLVVSLADKVHNARTIAADVERDGDAYFEHFTGGADGSRWYYRRLADVYEGRAAEVPAALLAELLVAIGRFGATEAAAAEYEAGWAPS